MNFLNKFKEYYVKILDSNSTAHGIALAVAIGIFIGCLLPIGTQTIPVIVLAVILRVDKLLAFASTFISNPYTVAFIYPIFCYTGAKVMGFDLTLSHIEKEIVGLFNDFSWAELKVIGYELGVSYFVGAFIYGVVLSVLSYMVVRYLIEKHRKKKKLKDSN